MLRYSNRAIMGLARLMSPYNDISIFCEDSSANKTKTAYFSSLLKDVCKIGRVFPLGDKSTVINAAKSARANNSKGIYIVDGDLDLLREQKPRNESNFYRLPVYCIENLMLDEIGILRFVNENTPHHDFSDIVTLLRLDEWYAEHSSNIWQLWIAYGFCYHEGLDVELTKYKVQRLSQEYPDRFRLDPSKISNRLAYIEEIIRTKRLKGKWLRFQRHCRKRFDTIPWRLKCDYISGKDYILPLILIAVGHFFKLQIPQDRFLLNVARLSNHRHNATVRSWIKRKLPQYSGL